MHGALAGGIIGYATPNTKLENCTNYGTVAHKCAAGGFAGWNEGTITGGSMAASLGNRETGYTYLGGVAGVNGGLIQSAYPAQGCAVRGDSYVGGIAGVNLGGDATASKGLIICTENNSTGTVEANQYAGGVAGANVGNISLSGQLQSSVTATGYAGGVAGINTTYNAYKGRIYGTENANGTVRGSVTAANYAGGVAGTNSAEITRVENHASVRASTKYAGGIAGVNDAGGTISYCSHASGNAAAVYATNGEAGGIAGNNNKNALIENVQVRADVTAANGTAGGVTATNFGIIGQETGLENNSSVSGCTITGTSESIGAVAAYNRAGATIRNVKLAAERQRAVQHPGGHHRRPCGHERGHRHRLSGRKRRADAEQRPARGHQHRHAGRRGGPHHEGRHGQRAPTFGWTLHKILINIQIWAASQARTTVP